MDGKNALFFHLKEQGKGLTEGALIWVCEDRERSGKVRKRKKDVRAPSTPMGSLYVNQKHKVSSTPFYYHRCR